MTLTIATADLSESWCWPGWAWCQHRNYKPGGTEFTYCLDCGAWFWAGVWYPSETCPPAEEMAAEYRARQWAGRPEGLIDPAYTPPV